MIIKDWLGQFDPAKASGEFLNKIAEESFLFRKVYSYQPDADLDPSTAVWGCDNIGTPAWIESDEHFRKRIQHWKEIKE